MLTHLEEARFQRDLEDTQDRSTRETHHHAPDRSHAQRMDALAKGNVIRTYRANLKRDIKAARVSILDLIEDPPEQIETMKVFDLLLSAPKYGRVKANKVLQTCRISPSKTVGGLSDRQRAEIVYKLRR